MPREAPEVFVGRAPVAFTPSTHLSVNPSAGLFVNVVNTSPLLTHTLTAQFRNQPAGVATLPLPLGPNGGGYSLPAEFIGEFTLDQVDAFVLLFYSDVPLALSPGTIGVSNINGSQVPVGVTLTSGNTNAAVPNTSNGVLVAIVEASGTALPTFNIAAQGALVYPPTYGPALGVVVASSLYFYRVPVAAGVHVIVANGVFLTTPQVVAE